MARAGINKLDVHKAATRLMEAGKNPTVDAVRDLLGTGSKSTIAPLLKQWKAQHGNWSEVQDTGLPVSLIGTVKALYEGMQNEAHEKVNEAQAIATEALEQSARALHDKEQALQSTQEELQEIEAYLKTANKANDILRKQRVEDALQTQQVNNENQALAGQLKTALLEIKQLTTLLQQGQENLEHYRDSMQQQRSQERNDMEQQLSQINTTLQISRQENKSINTQNTSLLATTKSQEEELIRASRAMSDLTQENAQRLKQHNKKEMELVASKQSNEQLSNKLFLSDKQLNKYREDSEQQKTNAQTTAALLIEAQTKVDIYAGTIQTLEQKNMAQMETVFKVKQENEQLTNRMKSLKQQTK